jgi:hypothetical protein
MKLIFCGDSHIVKIEAALNQRAPGIAADFPGEIKAGKLFAFPKALNSFFVEGDNAVSFSKPALQKSFRDLTGQPNFDPSCVYVLSLFFTNTILLRSSHWATHLPVRVCRDGFQPVSDAVMEAIVLEHFSHPLAFAAALLKHGIRIMALESPPPRRDDPTLSRHVGPADVLEIDCIARKVMKARLCAMGVPILDMPAAASDPADGFLAQAYYAERPGDYHHANAALGAMLLEATLDAVSATLPHAPGRQEEARSQATQMAAS